jgi:hypothetical protein
MITRRGAILTSIGAFTGAALPSSGAHAAKRNILAPVESGQMAAVIMTFRPLNKDLEYASIVIQNMETRRSYVLVMHAGSNWVNARASTLIVVPPGQYRVEQGLAGYGTRMPLLEFWFKPFTLGAGEIVDLGALRSKTVDVTSLANLRGLDNLLRFGNNNDVTTYLAYRMEDAETDVTALLTARHPSIIGRTIKRPLENAINQEEFENLVLQAYSPGPDGVKPTTSVAQARLNALIGDLIARKS